MKCPLVGAGLKITFAGFSIVCLSKQANTTYYDKDCIECLTGKDIKVGKYPIILPDNLILFRKDELPKNLKSPKIRVINKSVYNTVKQRGKSKYPFYRMKIGDIVFLNYSIQKTARSVMYNIMNKRGWNFITKKEGDKLRIERIR